MSAAAIAGGLEGFWLGMALHLWQSTLLLVVLGLLTVGLRHAPTRYTQALLWMALVKFLVPVAWVGAVLRPVLPVLGEAPASTAATVSEFVAVVLSPAVLAYPAERGMDLESGVFVAMTVLWTAGMAWLVLRWRRRWLVARHGRDSALAQAPRAIRGRIEAALRATAIDPAAVRLTTGRAIPCVRGLLRPRILLAASLVETLDEDELRAVLLHEESHRRRHDTLLATLQQGVLTMFFFFPPVWWLVGRLRASAESACDESVLEHGVLPGVYARTLVRVLSSGLPIASVPEVGFGRPAGLRERLDRIENSWRYRVMTRHRILLIVAVAVVLGSATVPALFAEERQAAPGDAEAAVPERVAAGPFTQLDRLVGIQAPVTLKLENVSIADFFAELEKSTSTRFQLEGELKNTVSVDYEFTPARSVLEWFARRNGLQYFVMDGWNVIVRRRPIPKDAGIRLAGVGDVTNPRLIPESKVQPEYPEEARVDRADGNVIVQAVIRADGTVDEVEVLRESNPRYPFADAAIAAVRQWRYTPSTFRSEPIDVYFTVFIEFKLH